MDSGPKYKGTKSTSYENWAINSTERRIKTQNMDVVDESMSLAEQNKILQCVIKCEKII